MSEEDYELLRKRFESRPLFVYYFYPDIELQEKIHDDWMLEIGFFEEGTDKLIGAGMYVEYDGEMYQGYFKDGCHHIYGRLLHVDGYIYEGGWDMDTMHGKGEVEYGDGTKEAGQWAKDDRQEEFKCYDNTGTLTHTKIYKDNIEIKSEEVKQNA